MNPSTLAFLIILLAIAGGAAYFIYQITPGQPVDLVVTSNISTEQTPPAEAVQFYPNMRFPSREITYKLDSACDSKKSQSVVEAFNTLQENTILSFSQSDKGQIEILCAEIAPEPDKKDYFVAGEGGPTEVINTTLYSVILGGKVSLYREEKCTTSHIAIHEILHVLGFDHSKSKKSLMYPTLDCSQTLGEEFINSINNLYYSPEEADLKIVSANATKSGAYLDFGVEVMNQGLKQADLSELSIYAGTKLVKKFSLKEIPIGTKKILTVTNLKVPRSAESIRFVVDPDNKVKELYEDNNELELMVS